jgi:hypothetical protein
MKPEYVARHSGSISDLSGESNILYKAKEFNIDIEKTEGSKDVA